MTLEAVTICVGYSDFLRETARINASYFDRWVIVTSKGDADTAKVCRDFNLPCLVTDDFGRGGDFNKGRGIQRGLNSISCADWVLHLDADIVLPPHFRQALAAAHLDQSKIYGCDRQMVVGRESWDRICESGYQQAAAHCYVQPHEKYPVGTRWVSPRDGYVPIGFFQLFHGSAMIRKGIHLRPYPAHHSDAARSDVQFGLQWDRRSRELLPEIVVWHLESEPAAVGTNWKGRKTKSFHRSPKKHGHGHGCGPS